MKCLFFVSKLFVKILAFFCRPLTLEVFTRETRRCITYTNDLKMICFHSFSSVTVEKLPFIGIAFNCRHSFGPILARNRYNDKANDQSKQMKNKSSRKYKIQYRSTGVIQKLCKTEAFVRNSHLVAKAKCLPISLLVFILSDLRIIYWILIAVVVL